MKRKTSLKIACAAVAAITAFSACACGDKGGGKVADVTIRSAISAVDVLADKSYDNFGAAKYEVTVARNEYESSQLIFTPDADVKSYKIEVADLYDTSGNKFPKESFEIYHEKYINITTGSEGGSTGVGKYADAILPFDKAAEYGENKMTKGENQGVLITAYPSKTQPRERTTERLNSPPTARNTKSPPPLRLSTIRLPTRLILARSPLCPAII